MKIELINTGTELLVGRRLNTHAQWLGHKLAEMGYFITKQTAVDDSAPAIREAVSRAMTETDLIITTGGLGPTSDDRTRDLIAELAGLPLAENVGVMANIERFFAARKRPQVPVSVRKQALVPAGATVLMNEHGTAPGLVIDLPRPNRAPLLLIMLPGPPRELCPMFEEQVAPLLRQRLPVAGFASHVFRTSGLGESFLEERVAQPLSPWTEAGMDLAYCAHPGEVEVRVSMSGTNAESIVTAAAAVIREKLGQHVFSESDDKLEAVIVRRLAERKQTLVVAESCTGGLLANRITDVPGASAIFLAGLVTYSNEAKRSMLGVRRETLEAHGAVSEETAREMVQGARERFKSDFALATTGIAGPSGGTEQKPVGTVYVALASAQGVVVQRHFNPYDRATFKWVSSQQALDRLRLALTP